MMRRKRRLKNRLCGRRRGARDVALIPAAELAGLIETAHLLRSPKNAERLLQALAKSVESDALPLPPLSAVASLEELRRSVPALTEVRG